jgi:predicted SnoaL-like aldol condensation-catalyzing enzyme
MTTHEQHLAEIYLEMLNTHAPGMVEEFVAENYLNHNAFVADGREATASSGPGSSPPCPT